MAKQGLYEAYHAAQKLQKRVISRKNFTYRHLIEVIDLHLGGRPRVLDIGCGVGTVDFYLARKAKRILGIDLSEKAIAVARQNAELLGLSKHLQFRRMNFPNEKPIEKFDLVLCFEALEHLEDDREAVRAIYRLLRKDGKFLISVPSKKAPLYRLGLLKKFDKNVGHLRRYDSRMLAKLLNDNRFSVEQLVKTEGILRNLLLTTKFTGFLIKFLRGPLSDFVTALDNLAVPLFGESQIIIVARKK